MADAQNCVVDACHFKYLSHYQAVTVGYNRAVREEVDEGKRGIVMGGSGNEFKNSSIEFSASNGFLMEGTNNTVDNCFMRVIGYVNNYDAAFQGLNDGDVISRTTVDIVGRSAINAVKGGKITMNIFRDAMALNGDGGTMYTYAQSGKGEISYNWFRNVIGRPGMYLYCDGEQQDPNPNFVVHHNVFMPSTCDRVYNLACGNGKFFNNTWASPHFMYDNFEEIHANTFTATSRGISKNDLVSTVESTIDTAYWKFTDVMARDFTLREGSPAIDAGEVIEGYTDGYVGKTPDLGAYEYGGVKWVPGHTWGDMPAVTTLWKAGISGQPAVASRGNIAKAATPSFFSLRKGMLLGDADAQIRVFDLQGKVIASKPNNVVSVKAVFKQGYYIVEIIKNNTVVRTKCLQM